MQYQKLMQAFTLIELLIVGALLVEISCAWLSTVGGQTQNQEDRTIWLSKWEISVKENGQDRIVI